MDKENTYLLPTQRLHLLEDDFALGTETLHLVIVSVSRSTRVTRAGPRCLDRLCRPSAVLRMLVLRLLNGSWDPSKAEAKFNKEILT